CRPDDRRIASVNGEAIGKPQQASRGPAHGDFDRVHDRSKKFAVGAGEFDRRLPGRNIHVRRHADDDENLPPFVPLRDTGMMKSPVDDPAASTLLGAEGPFAREVPNFAPRETQQRMADAVADAIGNHDALVVEAGTGTGKTFAYLVPALLSGKRVIVSTGTRNLQDQLFHRDLPRVLGILGAKADVALLKGRANYLCRYRLQQTIESGQFKSRTQVDDLQKVRAWGARTRTGDR